MRILTCFVLISALLQVGWAAAAERHWLAIPLLAAVPACVLVCAARGLQARRALRSRRNTGVADTRLETL